MLLFGASNVSYQIARDGQLPATFTKARRNRHIEGLFMTPGLSIVSCSPSTTARSP